MKIKTNVISEDFKEKGQRKFLNFGHTFAHGIEYANKENPVLHGHAVHIGMQMATEFSIQKKIISMEDYQIINLVQVCYYYFFHLMTIYQKVYMQ